MSLTKHGGSSVCHGQNPTPSLSLVRHPLANIGTFTKSEQGFVGEIVTLTFQARNVRLVPEANGSNENAPSHRAYVGRADYAELSIMRSGAVGAQLFRTFWGRRAPHNSERGEPRRLRRRGPGGRGSDQRDQTSA